MDSENKKMNISKSHLRKCVKCSAQFYTSIFDDTELCPSCYNLKSSSDTKVVRYTNEKIVKENDDREFVCNDCGSKFLGSEANSQKISSGLEIISCNKCTSHHIRLDGPRLPNINLDLKGNTLLLLCRNCSYNYDKSEYGTNCTRCHDTLVEMKLEEDKMSKVNKLVVEMEIDGEIIINDRRFKVTKNGIEPLGKVEPLYPYDKDKKYMLSVSGSTYARNNSYAKNEGYRQKVDNRGGLFKSEEARNRVQSIVFGLEGRIRALAAELDDGKDTDDLDCTIIRDIKGLYLPRSAGSNYSVGEIIMSRATAESICKRLNAGCL